ncbi:unnamed protein product [Mycena citricolor]|uniref:Uncharacterized protein n=1 Tax=Mycena citricolor TaxID=2018698 RepID=A0AAD2K4R0_9AGAR|nr:unnamed protein product [Mycena citricolor]
MMSTLHPQRDDTCSATLPDHINLSAIEIVRSPCRPLQICLRDSILTILSHCPPSSRLRECSNYRARTGW